jgi:hypothetical protein
VHQDVQMIELCIASFSQSPSQLKCSGVPKKSQIYYNSTNSNQMKPLSPGSVQSIDTAWWNMPIRNRLQTDISNNSQQQLLPTDALFGSFQLYDDDPTSSVSSYVCPGCDVEGTSRYLLEYFELFHAMKKTYYSRFLDENAPNRRDKMSECVEARTDDGIIKYLARMHAIDCQKDDHRILDRCEASELNITLMKNVLCFLKQQLTAEEQKELMRQIVINGKKRATDSENLEQSSTNAKSFESVPQKKRKVVVEKNEGTQSGEASKMNGRDTSLNIALQEAVSPTKSVQTIVATSPKIKGICYHKNHKKWEVKAKDPKEAKGKKYLGSYKTYEHALDVLMAYNSKIAAENDAEQSTPMKVLASSNESVKVSSMNAANSNGSSSAKPIKESVNGNEVIIGCYKNKQKAVEVLSSHTGEGSERLSSPRKKRKVEERKCQTHQYISYYSDRNRWIVRLGEDEKRKYIGTFGSYEEASSALSAYYHSVQNVDVVENGHLSGKKVGSLVESVNSYSQQMGNVIETGRSSGKKVESSVEPANGFLLMERGKLDSSYLVGMSVMLFNPVDNSYCSGRIVDFKQNVSATKDDSRLRRLLDTEIAETLYLVRFREGADGRKVAIHQWIYLEEHAVRIGGEVCWAKISDGIDVPINGAANAARMSPYRPVQIIFRSMLERISTLKESEGYRDAKSSGGQAFGNEICTTSVLAMGFGESFSSISIAVKPESDCLEKRSIKLATPDESNRPLCDSTIGSSLGAENFEISNQPVIFPFGVKDPSWLNQILRRVRLSDEDIGVAIALASMEQDANKRTRYSMGSA